MYKRQLAYWSLRPDAEGAEANSVKRQADHARFDSMVRARAIREDLQAGARPGAYLYQAHLAADLERRVIAVSYTHLDVYKRQPS